MRSILTTVLVVILGITSLWMGTDGFRAFTSEGARRIHIQENPREIPPVVLEDALGERFRFQDLQGKLILATFIYTRCGDVCPIVETNLATIYNQLPQEALGNDIVLMSVSFDSEYDTPEALLHHGHHYGADLQKWRFVRILESSSTQSLLDTFGVVVIPNQWGGFEHNAAFYLIDQAGKIVEIIDYDKPDLVLEKIKPLLS